MTSLWTWILQEKNENSKKSVVWGCKQAAKISIRLEYSNRMLVRELNWKNKFYMKKIYKSMKFSMEKYFLANMLEMVC